MSFTQENFAPSGSRSDAPIIYTYKTDDDIIDVIATDYFVKKKSQLNERDIIYACTAGSGCVQLVVSADKSTALPGTPTVYGSYSHSSDQSYTANVSSSIAFDTNGEFLGIEHSTSVDNDQFTFPFAGTYQLAIEPQYTRVSGGGTDVLNIFIAHDTGSGFTNINESNIKLAVNSADVTSVSSLTHTLAIESGEKVMFMAQSESSTLILDSFPASGVDPNDIPSTPSAILNIIKVS